MRIATEAERLLQRSLRGAAAAWAGLRQALDPVDLDRLAGKRCHCPRGLPLHFVHSEALREACDLVVDFGTNVRPQGRPAVPVAHLASFVPQLRAGSVVHVKTDLLAPFVQVVLPRILEPIVLVTGDSDAPAGARHRDLLDHPRIAHWFVQNCDYPGRHSKLTRIPIGLDNPVFTKWEKRLGFALTQILGRSRRDPSCTLNDMGQQADLLAVRAGLPPIARRSHRVLCTFHQNQKLVAPDLSGFPQRAEAVRALGDKAWCHFPAKRLPQAACWRAHGAFAFELSPAGNGLDCFRTWEALALGTIPIVMTSTLDPLYEDEALPVVMVRSWSEVTPEALERWAAHLQPRFGADLDRKLGAEQWIAKIRAESGAARARRAF